MLTYRPIDSLYDDLSAIHDSPDRLGKAGARTALQTGTTQRDTPEMPLHPQAKAFLEQLESEGAPPFYEMTVLEARAFESGLEEIQGDPEEVTAPAGPPG